MWTSSERKFLRGLSTPVKVQDYLNQLVYNTDNSAFSPRYVMITNEGHCFEGCMLAAAALEFQGHKPLIVDLRAHKDDDHVICVYKTKTGWGSLSKSNTVLLAGREPYFRTIRELVMSYFNFYFNVKGKLSLYAYSNPINLNRYNHLNWRTTDIDLAPMGMTFTDKTHFELISLPELTRISPVTKRVMDACFLGADPNGLYEVT